MASLFAWSEPHLNLWFLLKEGIYEVNPNIESTPGDDDKVVEPPEEASLALWSNICRGLVKKCV